MGTYTRQQLKTVLFLLLFSLLISYAKADTFGRTEGTDSSDQNINGYIAGSYAAPASDGTATSITAYLKNWGNPVKCALYQESDDALIGYTEEQSLPEGGARDWVTFNFISNPSISSGVDYYIVAWAGGACYLGYDATGDNIGAEDSETYNGFPNPWNPSAKDRNCSIYCTYTPSAGGQDLTFTLVGNAVCVASPTRAVGLAWTLSGLARGYASAIFNKAFIFTVGAVAEAAASVSVGRGLLFAVGAVGRAIGSVVTTFEGPAQDLTFILYAGARAVAAAIMTPAEAAVYATVGFVLSAILLLLFLGGIVLALLLAATRRRL